MPGASRASTSNLTASPLGVSLFSVMAVLWLDSAGLVDAHRQANGLGLLELECDRWQPSWVTATWPPTRPTSTWLMN